MTKLVDQMVSIHVAKLLYCWNSWYLSKHFIHEFAGKQLDKTLPTIVLNTRGKRQSILEVVGASRQCWFFVLRKIPKMAMHDEFYLREKIFTLKLFSLKMGYMLVNLRPHKAKKVQFPVNFHSSSCYLYSRHFKIM